MPHRSNSLRPEQFAALCGSTVVRVVDLEQLGLHRSTISHRCRPGGPWRSLAPGVVLLHNAAPRRNDRRRAALLHAGPGAVMTGVDALHLAGMRRMPAPSGPVHVLLPADRRRVGYGLALIERTDRLPAPLPGQWPLVPIVRAVLDYARRSDDRNQVRAAIAEVVQRGRCTPGELATELDAGSDRGAALPRDVLREVGAGIRSVAEATARELLARSRLLHGAMWNPRLHDMSGRFVAMPDAWFDDVGMAWEIDSYEWHLSPADYDTTLDRRSTLTAEGVLVVHTQPQRLRRDPARVLDELERTHEQARQRPRPPLFAIPAATTNGTLVG